MAGNKFATMLHRKTHKVALILTYAILEWILILLLLVNSLLSYLIIKFAVYFGLKPPCLWCSRVDHIIDTSKHKSCYRDLMCDAHATEISQLGYCSKHRKLVESHDMCEDCSSSRPDCNGNLNKIGKVSLFSWSKDIGMISCDGEKKIENGEKDLRCSCCDVSFEREVYSPYVLFKPSSWGVLDYTQKGNFIKEGVEDGGESSDPCKSDCPTDHCDEEEYGNREEHEENGVASEFDDEGVRRSDEERESWLRCKEIEGDEDDLVGAFAPKEKEPCVEENDLIVVAEGTNVVQFTDHASFEVIPVGWKNFSDLDDDRFVSIELIDSATLRSEIHTASKHFDLNGDVGYGSLMNGQDEVVVDSREEVRVDLANEREDESMNMIEKGISPNESHVEVSVVEVHDKVAITRARTQTVLEDTEELAASNGDALRDESTNHTQVYYEPNSVPPSPQPNLPLSNHDDKEECVGVGVDSNAYTTNENDLGLKQAEMLDKLSLPSELNVVVEEESVPETPTYADSFHHILHKKSSSFERKESGAEESLDGSVISEIENGEGSLTVERLKTALKAEHKALTALYAELEEERSASAIAANQTMAMITRLQEEKAIMQMEALHYQRMMEEQSEYDQEALQLMNGLMLKREREKQELEKELEVYRKKVLHYEAKQKRMMRDRASSDKSRTSSVSSSNVDSEELSVDLNHEAIEEDNFFGHQENNYQKTAPDAVVSLENVGLEGLKHMSTLDESLADFEDERQSILEQLKALEEKLFTLGNENEEEEEEEFENVRAIQHLSEVNGKDFSENYEIKNEDANGFSDDSGEKHCQERRNVGVNAKRLLPLFDAIGMDNGDEELNEEHEHGSIAFSSQNYSVSKFTSNDEKFAIEEEVDHVYERLQALEADREFLKHCVGSLKKGNKGMDLLQEILQHLRDLRTVELRVKSMGDLPAMS